MRNIPLAFLDETTIEHINRVNRSTKPEVANRSRIAKFWHALLSNLDGDGPRSIAALERAMKGPSHPTSQTSAKI